MRIEKTTPEAQFDSLSIGVKFYNYFDGFDREDIQLFSYFSSVLFPYTKEPSSEWKYRYTINSATNYPFSSEINSAIELHMLNGNFIDNGNFIVVSPSGIKTFEEIKDLHSFRNREKSINAACTTSVLLPFKETEHALLNDPEIAQKKESIDNPQWLNQDFVIERIADVSNKLGVPIDNLTASSVSWIKYLLLIQNQL
jgi:hypothetical protein